VTRVTVLIGACIAASVGCGGGGPAVLDSANDMCTSCRMIVSDVHLAAQIAVPGEESRFFDDIACLADYLQKHPQTALATVYVADHRTGEWVPVEQAIFGRLPRPSTPMASGLLAHASDRSKAQDPGARDAAPVSRDVAFGSRRNGAR
jgi:hypothetical protein